LSLRKIMPSLPNWLSTRNGAVNLTGKLLAAMPSMEDARFDHALILICAHSDDGAMGLIVNTPLPDLNFATLLGRVGIKAPSPPDLPVYYGGPVERGRGFILHQGDYDGGSAVMDIAGGFHMSATLDVLEALANGTGPNPALLTLGYSGWGPNQLEAEIAANAWLTLDGSADIVFGAQAGQKWGNALRLAGVNPMMLSGAAGRA
jgi:putative transcriptional regulator